MARFSKEYAEFCRLLVEADRGQEWLADGSPNVAQWLTARFGFDERFGRRITRLAKRLQDLPELAKRFAAGELSLDAVELMAEVATPENESHLIDLARGRDLHDIGRLTSRARPPTREEGARDRKGQWFSTQWDLQHRRMRMAGEMTGYEAQAVEDRIVEVAKTIPRNLETGEYDNRNRRMADSLFEICATASGEGSVPITVVHTEWMPSLIPTALENPRSKVVPLSRTKWPKRSVATQQSKWRSRTRGNRSASDARVATSPDG